jgi:hypothetical protein
MQPLCSLSIDRHNAVYVKLFLLARSEKACLFRLSFWNLYRINSEYRLKQEALLYSQMFSSENYIPQRGGA